VNRRTLLRFLVLHGIAAADPAPGSPPPPATPDPFAGVSSKKGLQVQMIDDAIALGVRHAGLNVDLCELIARDDAAPHEVIVHRYDGGEFRFRRDTVEAHDRRIRGLSDRDVLVYLILLVYRGTAAWLGDAPGRQHLDAGSTQAHPRVLSRCRHAERGGDVRLRPADHRPQIVARGRVMTTVDPQVTRPSWAMSRAW
jgi:hypothetical protein